MSAVSAVSAVTSDQTLAQRAVAWLRGRDPNFGALRRAGRTAIVMPLLFAFGDKVVKNPGMAYFLAFGSFAMLLMVDFQGSRLDRLRSQALLGVACAVNVCIGTLVSQTTALATIVMFIIAFAILFSGIVSSVIAGATTPLLLSLILPITVPGPASQIPDRVAGWGIAAAVSLFAITFLWPTAVAYPVEGRAIAACRAIAARIRAETAWIIDGTDELQAAYRTARVAAEASIDALDKLFLGTPYRPTGLTTKARAEIRLVDELRWLSTVILRSATEARPERADMSVCEVKLAAATVLEATAGALDSSSKDQTRAQLAEARETLRSALHELENHTTSLPAGQRQLGDGHAAAAVVSAFDPSFRAQELAYVTDQIAVNADFAAAAAQRTWMQRLLGQQPVGFTGPVTAARERALAHAEPGSSWLHNSLRGATALALAVLVADLTSVQHGFWVVFGTLAVLRSNALSTGQNVMRGLLGTSAGFLVGGALVALIGTNTTVLWVLLPIVILCAGLAPTVVSFAAGQAAFTVTLLIIFNLLAPGGWHLGLVRVEDVAIGGAVSLAVGLLFWPRGAGVDLGHALGRAYVDSSIYLSAAVSYGVACCGAMGPKPAAPVTLAQEAAASARRLDDTFRGYLTERGAKRVPLADVTTLVTGVAGVRLAADAVLDLWEGDGHVPGRDGDRAAATQQLAASARQLTDWYDRFAASLESAAEVPDPLNRDEEADDRLVGAVASDLRDGDGNQTATGVRVIWTGDHLDAVRRLQESLVGPARAALGAGFAS